ncbi:MAG: ABC transporter ATP-binding protein [Bacteroidota bacterium]
MMLEIERLSKIYGNGTKALDDINIVIKKGMFGLLGPNGAGKSTLMRIIATLQLPSSGMVRFKGSSILDNPYDLRKTLGYLPQSFGVYPNVSAERLLDYFAALKGIMSAKERRILIEKVLFTTNLLDVRKKSVSGYSGGMKQRFGIAQLLLNDPQLIIVDEPTAGLDPVERNRFLNLLREIGAENTVIFSTHIVEDMKDLCTDIGIIEGGILKKHATPKELLNALKGKIWNRNFKQEQQNINETVKGSLISTGLTSDNDRYLRVFSKIHPGNGYHPVAPTLEDIYFLSLDVNNVQV